MKTETTNLINDLMQGITKVFLVLMIGVFPFYYQNNYINIVSAKSSFFSMSVIVLMAISIVFIIPSLVQSIKIGSILKKISVTDYFAILFAFTVIISCIFSPAGSEAFWGTQGRQLGGKIFLLCVAAYFIVSRYYKSGQILLWVFFVANCLMCVLISLNFWGIDPLHIYSNLEPSQYPIFMGTLGNININSGYMGVICALFMGFYYLAEEKLTKICFGGAVILGVYTCFATSSYSWVLAVGGTYLILLMLAMKDVKRLKKWWSLCVYFWIGSTLMKLTERIDIFTGAGNQWILSFRGQKLLYNMLDWKILLFELILIGICGLILLRSRNMDMVETYGNKVFLVALLISAVIATVKVFPLEDSFGSGRGYIWKSTIANFTDLPTLQKLFGYGPNCFLQSMNPIYEDKLLQQNAQPFIDAHNELLQFLTVTGILGMISYMGMQISLLVSCIRMIKTNKLAIIGGIGIMAYMLQGLVNNPQVFTTPLLFIFLGIMDNRINREQDF